MESGRGLDMIKQMYQGSIAKTEKFVFAQAIFEEAFQILIVK